MSRKTIHVERVVLNGNSLLASDHAAFGKDFRLGIIAMVESALFLADNYKGFNYLLSEWDDEAGVLRDGYDDTRREYYV